MIGGRKSKALVSRRKPVPFPFSIWMVELYFFFLVECIDILCDLLSKLSSLFNTLSSGLNIIECIFGFLIATSFQRQGNTFSTKAGTLLLSQQKMGPFFCKSWWAVFSFQDSLMFNYCTFDFKVFLCCLCWSDLCLCE